MLTRWPISATGRLVAFLPRSGVSALCCTVGWIFFTFFRRRRVITISNFIQAFPEKSFKKCKKLALKSSVRTIELGLLAIALPYFSEKKIRKLFRGDASIDRFFSENHRESALILVPHFSQMEAMTVLPLLYPELQKRSIGVLYRPFRNKPLEQWVKQTRERFGLKLLSRHHGLFKAYQILKRKGIMVVLFDQNARHSGILSNFMGRIASTTPLPDLFYRKFHCPIYALLPKRTGIFSATCSLTQLFPSTSLTKQLSPGYFSENATAKPSSLTKITQPGNHFFDYSEKNEELYPVIHAMNRWLEQQLQNEELCCDWLWAHNRWHICDEKHNWLALHQPKTAIHWDAIRKIPRIFVLLPDQVDAALNMFPLLRTLREARPDCQNLLLVSPNLAPLCKQSFLQENDCADQILILERPRLGHFWHFFKQLLAYRLPQPLILIDGSHDHHLSHWVRCLLQPKIFSAFYPPSSDSKELQTYLQNYLQDMGFHDKLSLDLKK